MILSKLILLKMTDFSAIARSFADADNDGLHFRFSGIFFCRRGPWGEDFGIGMMMMLGPSNSVVLKENKIYGRPSA